jgi:hypothetical protein
MSSRNRQPRASLNQDADEERRLWNMIREGAKKIDSMVVRFFLSFLVLLRCCILSCFSLLLALFSMRFIQSTQKKESTFERETGRKYMLRDEY